MLVSSNRIVRKRKRPTATAGIRTPLAVKQNTELQPEFRLYQGPLASRAIRWHVLSNDPDRYTRLSPPLCYHSLLSLSIIFISDILCSCYFAMTAVTDLDRFSAPCAALTLPIILALVLVSSPNCPATRGISLLASIRPSPNSA